MQAISSETLPALRSKDFVRTISRGKAVNHMLPHVGDGQAEIVRHDENATDGIEAAAH